MAIATLTIRSRRIAHRARITSTAITGRQPIAREFAAASPTSARPFSSLIFSGRRITSSAIVDAA
jgi:hypothetical protein